MYRLMLVAVVMSAACTLWAEEKPAAAEKSKAKKNAVAIKGTPKIDAKVDKAWLSARKVRVNKPVADLLQIEQDEMAKAVVRLMWDEEHLYALWRVKDPALSAAAGDPWEQDSVELFVDPNNEKSGSYESDDAQYRVSFEGKVSGQGDGYDESDVQAAARKIKTGYVVEMAVRIDDVELTEGAKLGLELQVNDDHGAGMRQAVAKWHHVEDDSWEDTSTFGTLELK